ncbi:hypothetical protein ACQCU1_06890 [Sutcliffiella horikoshii]|uniref:Uncharacterized protein n=1 Tax=Sutcliffiella horikoshii TaxID=79883 RepID=A0A1Y0CM92_9BACI|nr:hypothetical protein [Sutcliffiella horikoshii]ART76027.1 hypothetical protein B4U37_08275 [Sutcliffiella horikoshii]TYS61294.1 hypothetical protein FZC74_03190 [Sutcliffiella horikoshii]
MSDYSPNFFIGSIRIGVVESASCINMGNNYPSQFQSHKKHNQGVGNISGDENDIHGTKSQVSDSSFIDMFEQTEDQELPQWLQNVIKEKEGMHAEEKTD